MYREVERNFKTKSIIRKSDYGQKKGKLNK